MKKLLLSLTALVVGFASFGQGSVVVAGVSPAAIQGNYDYSNQANCGSWPGETDDGTWGVINNLDFNVAGTFIQDTLVLVEDGTPGLNPQGNPISQEGCDSIINPNEVNGQIAVIYRNSCSFVQKLLNAQEAGAVAAIIVNREDALLGMLGDAVDGINVTIPAVFISNIDGANLISEMSTETVEMFIGNKIGAFPIDLGAVKGEFMVSPYGANNAQIFDGFDLGMQVYNYGTTDLPNAKLYATIDGPSGNVYSDSVSIPLNTGDTAFVFNGNPTELTQFNLGGVGNYPNGEYTLTYTLASDSTDDFPFDNVYVSTFKVLDDVLASSRVDASSMPIATNYPSNNTVISNYESCMVVQEPNIDGMIIDGLYFIPTADTAAGLTMVGAEVLGKVYQWNDPWIDINDPVFATDPFTDLNVITVGSHFPVSDNDINQPAWLGFQQPLTLQNDVRYLVCLQSTGNGVDPIEVWYGYDNQNDNGGNYSLYAQPFTPVQTDNNWFAAGWVGGASPSIALHQTFLGVDNETLLSGNVFPNPANDKVTLAVNTSGDALIQVVDITGKLVLNESVTLVNGQTTINIDSFDAGVYMFNVLTKNGKAGTFNVVKQ
jgi:hypothetical protein